MQLFPNGIGIIEGHVTHVQDSGFILQGIPWKKDETFKCNKQNFICLFCEAFEVNGIDWVNASADADVRIPKKRIERGRKL